MSLDAGDERLNVQWEGPGGVQEAEVFEWGCSGWKARAACDSDQGLTRTSFIRRPATFQSCTYRLPLASQYEP